MELLKRILSVFLLVLFMAYSGGVGFFIHNCEHCHQKKIYLLTHPDCCSAATEEHHHQADSHKKDSSHKGVCRSHQEEKMAKCKKNASTPHCQPCCFSEFRFFKIYGSYFAPKYEKWIDIANFLIFKKTLPFDLQPCISEKIGFSKNKPEPPPLLPGGKCFIIFSHQLLFYA